MRMDRFHLMAAQLAGAPVPALPDRPGRLVVAVFDGSDPVATAWEEINGRPPAAINRSIRHAKHGRASATAKTEDCQ